MVRLAVAWDTTTIAAIAESAYSRYIPLIGKRPAPMDADFGKHIERGETFVLEIDGVVSGFIIHFATSMGWFVENIAVDANCQGAGIGFQLMCDADQRCLASGCDRIYLYTNEVMTDTFSWYLKHDFLETHRTTEDGFNRIYMEKLVVP